MITEKKILMIDFTNYEDYPIGGFLSFARNMISSFGDQLGLIGISTADNEPVGRWFIKRIDGIDYDYFALARFSKEQTRHIIPDRLMCYFLLKYYRKKILEPDYKNVFVQRHEILPAIRNFGFKNICYRFPGLENPLAISKYPAGRYFFRYFDKMFFSGLKNVQLILAAGDNSSIDDMISRSRGIISRNSVVQFPTRIDTDIFRPLDKREARSRLNIPDSSLIVTTTGRLASLKGWKFMVDCFSVFAQSLPESLFYIIGDGEEFWKLSEYLVSKNCPAECFLPAETSLKKYHFI
jgi:glycosyltransferase involved in cell wall biosynthesis